MTLPKRTPIEIGNLVRQLREGLGLTQLQLAARAGVTDTTVRSVEGAKKAYHRSTLAAIATALGTTADALKGSRSEPKLEELDDDASIDWDELP